MIKTFLMSAATLTFLVNASVAQDPGTNRDPEKAKAERRAKIIEVISTDLGHLKLPENHAFVSAKLGAAIWKTDPERAGVLFRNAIDALMTAQGIAEANKNPHSQNYDLLWSSTLRPLILNTIAASDGDLALEAFYRTRPTAVQKAFASGPPSGKVSNPSGNAANIVQQELALEQRLIRISAEQKPERMVSILKETIKKHLSGETLEMLKKVWDKDPVVGKQLANDVVSRLTSRPFVDGRNHVNHELINVSNAIIAEHLRERSRDDKGIVYDDSLVRALAVKLISTYLANGPVIGYVPVQQLEPIARRFSPGSVEPLKKLNTNSHFSGRHGMVHADPEYSKLMSSNPTAETLIGAAKNFPVESRGGLYLNAANKLTDAGQYEQAVALLSSNFEDDALENAISSLNWYQVHHLMNRGEFNAAESMIMQFGESNRITALIALATRLYGANPEENRSRAISLLQRVRSLLPDRPGSNNELQQLFELINSMVNIDQAEAFRTFEPVIDTLNQLTEAWAIVQGFQGGYLRNGEYMMSNGQNFGIYLNQSIFQGLAQRDFARTMTLIDSFSRREMRLSILLGLLESGG